MLAYTLKNVVELIPSALAHVKQASIVTDFPTDNRDSAVASALSIQYCQHVSGKSVDPYQMEKVAAAVSAYGADDIVRTLTEEMIEAHTMSKIASSYDPVGEYHTKTAGFEGDLTGFRDLEALGEAAEELYKEAQDLGVDAPETVRRYSGNAFLSKKAALDALAARYQASGNVGFAKIAASLGRLDTDVMPTQTVQDICRTVSSMDKQAGLASKGFDFYREALLTKEAEIVSAMSCRLAGHEVPYERIAKVGKDRISQYIGADVAKEMDGGPAHFKQVAETLPMDLQRIVLDLTKNT